MILDIDPKVDVAFKKLFGNEDEAPLLVSLLNAVIEPATLDVPEIRRAMEVLMKFSQDEIERWAYEDRLKAIRDQSSLLREVRESREAQQAAQQALEAAQQALE